MNKEIIKQNWTLGNIKSVEKVDSFSGKVKKITKDDGQIYFLKEKEDIDKCQLENRLLIHLDKNKLPVAVPIKTTTDELGLVQGEKVYCIYPSIIGESFEDHYGEEGHKEARLLGNSIGLLHKALKNYDPDGYRKMDLVYNVLEWANQIINKNKKYFDLGLFNNVKTYFKRSFVPIYDKLPQQLIHRDIHPQNMLFDNYKLSGIIDFDSIVYGVRIFDPCYCGTSILVGGFDDEEKREKWLDIFKSIIDGYHQQVVLTEAEVKSIIHVLMTIQIIYMAFSCNIDSIDAAKYNQKVLKWLYDNRESIEENLLK